MRHSQKQNILNYLSTGNEITPLEALNKFGCFRLGAVIFELKQQGYKIGTRMATNGNKHFAAYKLIGKTDISHDIKLSMAMPKKHKESELFKFKADPIGRQVTV